MSHSVPEVSAKPKEIRVFLWREVDAGHFTPLDLHSASWAGLLLSSESVHVAATKCYYRVMLQLQNCSLTRVTQGDCSLKTKEKTERQCGQ
jgi:hypothetical protein